MAEIAYDFTRLLSRFLNKTPNGIDRVDMAWARNFLINYSGDASGVIFAPGLGYCSVRRRDAARLIEMIGRHFGEMDLQEARVGLDVIEAWLRSGRRINPGKPNRIERQRSGFAFEFIPLLLANLGVILKKAERCLTRNARLINVSQYPLNKTRALQWLDRRGDIKPVFFVHDLLPLQTPEYFRPPEFARHTMRLRNAARFAAGIVVSTQTVKVALESHLDEIGSRQIPIFIARPSVSPLFARGGGAHEVPYFVQCGTLEPRKNHLLSLNVWRELVARRGAAAPKLIIVGARGWHNQNAIDLLERCPALHDHVLEANGLPTPALVRLMQGARALLMPSYAEGFGLPVAEALAVGTPIIASDIPVFREIASASFTALSPIDGEGWLRAIEKASAADPAATSSSVNGVSCPTSEFRAVEEFIASL